jgi:hypothetical protein
MSEKQTTFFTVNCAEKLKSPNQCVVQNVVQSMKALLNPFFNINQMRFASFFDEIPRKATLFEDFC